MPLSLFPVLLYLEPPPAIFYIIFTKPILSNMPPKRCHSDRSSTPESTSADKMKRRRTEPEDEGIPAVPSTPTSSSDSAVSSVSNTELADYEVFILLGTLTIKVRRQQLRDAFGYFAKFTLEEFPKQFSFTAKNDPEDWLSWWLLPSEVYRLTPSLSVKPLITKSYLPGSGHRR